MMDFTNIDNLREYIDVELRQRYYSKLSELFVEDMPDSLLGLFCVVMDGTHFVTREAIQSELQEMKITVSDEAIDQQLEKWRAQPIPSYKGILH